MKRTLQPFMASTPSASSSGSSPSSSAYSIATLIQSAMLKTPRKIHRPYPSIFYYPGLSSSKKVYNPADFAFAKTIEQNTSKILEEYRRLQESGVESDYDTSRDESHKLHEGSWSWNSYITKGHRQADFASRCTTTVEILESVPTLMTGTPFSFAFFSSLQGNSKISAHHGPCNLRLRCHLPLIVPDGDCGMEIGGEVVRWEEGKLLIFDDCYEHAVWNTSDSERVLLLFDIWHPDLHQEEIDSIIRMFEYAEKQQWIGGKKKSSVS